jgi:hypothetical protein
MKGALGRLAMEPVGDEGKDSLCWMQKKVGKWVGDVIEVGIDWKGMDWSVVIWMTLITKALTTAPQDSKATWR